MTLLFLDYSLEDNGDDSTGDFAMSEKDRLPACESILIVEDDEGIRNALQIALEMEGYEVYTAENGQEGLNILPQMPKPCLILLDLMMPVMNGWEFVEGLEKDSILASIPVVIVSAFSENMKAIKSIGIVKKPVDLDALFKLVKESCPGNSVTHHD